MPRPSKPSARGFATLLRRVRACELCAASLPLGPRPVLQADPRARILIAGQAPGRRVHETGIPFNDPSGERLREWLGVSREEFYDPARIALLPMGFCFPGTGSSGDLPPRPECAPAWRQDLLSHLGQLQLTVVLGAYAAAYHVPGPKRSVTDAVRDWRESWPTLVPLPHPSPRNRLWVTRNPWFETELLPQLRQRVRTLLRGDA